MEYFIGLDIGTSSIKGVLLSYDGDKESLASIAARRRSSPGAARRRGHEYVGYSAESSSKRLRRYPALLNSRLTQLVAVRALSLIFRQHGFVSDKGSRCTTPFLTSLRRRRNTTGFGKIPLRRRRPGEVYSLRLADIRDIPARTMYIASISWS